MNDPHRVQGAPSLRYWSHLVAPGWNVIGGGEPMLPGVSIGHNDVGAWGLTIFGTDGEDLYVYETNPANPNQYKYRGAWEDMRVVKDTIAVKGAAPTPVDLKFTRHGPVLFEDPAHHKAYALRAAWMEIGAAPYLASLRMDQARTWEEFREACTYSRIPAENMMWADASGTIGYQAVAITPIRPQLVSGLVPVPGDGRYEWDGYLPIKALPHVVNPQKGYCATANNYLFPARLSVPRGAALHRHRPVPRLAHQRGPALRAPPHGRRHDAAAERRPVAAGAGAGAAAARPAGRRRRRGQGAGDAARLELRPRQGLGRRRHLRDVAAASARQHAQPARAGGGRGDFGGLSMKKIIEWLHAPDGRFGDNPIAGRDRGADLAASSRRSPS